MNIAQFKANRESAKKITYIVVRRVGIYEICCVDLPYLGNDKEILQDHRYQIWDTTKDEFYFYNEEPYQFLDAGAAAYFVDEGDPRYFSALDESEF